MGEVGPRGWEDPVEWPTSRLWQAGASSNSPRRPSGSGSVRRLVARMGTFMAMAGAVGLVGMALVGAVEVGASSTSPPSNGTIYFTCFLNQGSQGSSCQTGSDVQKASYDYQGGVLSVGQPQAVANTKGADGLQFLGNGDLVVAGQQSGGVTEVVPSSAKVVARVSTTLSSVDHISLAPSGQYLTAGGYGGGGLDLIPVSSGVIQNGISCQLQQPAGTAISSSGVVMDTVAWTPSGQAYYTQSNRSDLYGGYGTFGAISISYTAGTTPSCSAVLTPIRTGFPAAHGMAYDPYSGDLILFGSQMVAQMGVSGTSATVLSEVTFGGQACTPGLTSCLQYSGNSGSSSQDMFDQGAVDGQGHLFVSNNNGDLAFVDYSQSPSQLIAGTTGAPSYVYDHFETTAMDDVAPLVGSGGPLEVNTQALPSSATVGQPLQDSVNVLNAQPGGQVQFQLFGPGDQNCTVGAGEPAYSSPAISYTVGVTVQSPAYTPTLPGTYEWLVSYSNPSAGQAGNSGCGREPVVIQQVTPQITTNQVTPIVSANGNAVSDSAQLGGFYPDPSGQGDGQLIFGLFADQGCAISEGGPGPITTVTAPVAYDSATGQYGATVNQTLSAPLVPGTYYWEVMFLGSTDDAPVTSTCGEPLVVEPSTEDPLTTQPTPSMATVGTPISDTATISRLAENPAQIPTTDTVSFQVVSSCPATPNTPPVAGTVLFDLGSFPVTITAQGSGYVGTAVASPSSLPVPASPGTYYWNVSFSGDAYNAPISNQCGEPVVLAPTTPTITTTPSPGGAVGTTLTDTATIRGLFDPVSSDRVDFSLYSDSSCSAGALVQDLGSVSLGSPNNGVWTVESPGGAKPSVAQTYYWGVTFTPAEDANNPGVTVCGEPVTVTSAGGVLGASTGSTPTTGAELLLPGVLASLFLLLGGSALSLGLRLRGRATS